MLTLYYSPGACLLAPHIALEETGAAYALQLVSIAKGEQQGIVRPYVDGPLLARYLAVF